MSVAELESIGITPESISAAIEGSHRGWLFEQDGIVGGFAMGDSANAEVTVMAMLPEFENQGIGGELLRRVEQWLYQEGCDTIWLTTDINPQLRAYGFYLHHGWKDLKIEHGLRFMNKSRSN